MATSAAEGLAQLSFLRDAADYAPADPPAAGQATTALQLAREFLQGAGVELPEH